MNNVYLAKQKLMMENFEKIDTADIVYTLEENGVYLDHAEI